MKKFYLPPSCECVHLQMHGGVLQASQEEYEFKDIDINIGQSALMDLF